MEASSKGFASAWMVFAFFTILTYVVLFFNIQPSQADTNETCNNLVDDNGDALIDCSDPQCANHPHCTCSGNSSSAPKENCSNSVDDNDDTLIDCSDPQCAYHADCNGSASSNPRENCTNSVDDNSDTLIDCSDPQCAYHPGCMCGGSASSS